MTAQHPDDLLEDEAGIQRIEKMYAQGLAMIQNVYLSIDPLNFDPVAIKSKIDKITQDLENGTAQWISEEFGVLFADASVVAKKMINKEP